MVAFFGHVPCTVRAVTLTKDGEPIGIGGVAYEGQTVKLFMDLRDERYPLAMVKATRAFLDTLRDHHVLYAVACSERAERFLSWLGFEHYSASPEGEVYQWHT